MRLPLLRMGFRYKDIKIQFMPSKIQFMLSLEWKGRVEVEGREGKKKVDEHSHSPVVWLCGIGET